MDGLKEITDIERYMLISPHVKDLGENPYPKDVYAAYAKVVLKQGDTLNPEVDKKILLAMQNDGVDIEDIAKALSFSPNLLNLSEEDIIKTFIRQYGNAEIWAKRETKRYLMKVFEVTDLSKLPDFKEDYVRYALKVLKPGEGITPQVDDRIVALMYANKLPAPMIWRALASSPVHKEVEFLKRRLKWIKYDIKNDPILAIIGVGGGLFVLWHLIKWLVNM